MAEFIDRNDADRFTADPGTEELRKMEEGVYLAAKRGSLFMPKMTRREWAKFCRAATIEEHERQVGVPAGRSQLTKGDREALGKITRLRSPAVRKMLQRREELIETQRPQCVDPNDEEFEDAILEELGMTAEEFSQVDKKVGHITPQEWEDMEAKNRPNEEEEEYY